MKSKRVVKAQVQPIVRCWIIEGQEPKGPYLILKTTKSGWLYLDGIKKCLRIGDIYQSKHDAWQYIIRRFERDISFLKRRLVDAKVKLLICDT